MRISDWSSDVCSSDLATREKVNPEDLGGWRVHAEITGFADMVVDSDEEAISAVKTFLSYLPDHHKSSPPEYPVPTASGADMTRILDFLPARRTQVYDVRRIIQVGRASCRARVCQYV